MASRIVLALCFLVIVSVSLSWSLPLEAQGGGHTDAPHPPQDPTSLPLVPFNETLPEVKEKALDISTLFLLQLLGGSGGSFNIQSLLPLILFSRILG